MPLAKKDLQDPVFKTNKNQNSKGKELIIFGRMFLALGTGLVLLGFYILSGDGPHDIRVLGFLGFGFTLLVVSLFLYMMHMLRIF